MAPVTLKKVLQPLNQPFPILHVIRYRYYIGFAYSVFTTLFMLWFYPAASIELPKENRTWLILSYGVICFSVIAIIMTVVPVVLKKRIYANKLKVYHKMLLDFVVVVLVSLIVFFYHISLGLNQFNIKDLLYILLDVFIIAVIPIQIMVVLVFNYVLRKSLKLAHELQQTVDLKNSSSIQYNTDKIILNDVMGKELLTLKPDNLVLLRSADNYVEVFWTDNLQINHTLLRQTMKHLENQLEPWGLFFRSHRTCIVNLNKVVKITGNSLGCIMKLDGVEEEVPVSRSFRNQLYTMLSEKVVVK